MVVAKVNVPSGLHINNIPITANTTFFALWTINSYLVTFDTGDVETTTTQQVIYGAYAIEPEQPTKTGYTFAGWSLDGSTSVTVSSTVIVQATTFTVTKNYGESFEMPTKGVGEFGSIIDSWVREDRVFVGWKINVNSSTHYEYSQGYSYVLDGTKDFKQLSTLVK